MFNGLTPRQLVMWERPAASGVVCGGVVAFVLLIGVFDYTLVTLLCRIAQLAILAGIVMKYLGKLPEKSCNPSECITQMGTSIEPIISSSLSFAFKVLTWENTLVSGKVLLASIVVAMLGNWFSDITLLFLVTVGVFTVPMGVPAQQGSGGQQACGSQQDAGRSTWQSAGSLRHEEDQLRELREPKKRKSKTVALKTY